MKECPKKLLSILIIYLIFSTNTIMICFAASRSCDVYYANESSNFGDQLNEDLLKYFSIDFNHTNITIAEYIFIGSILDWGYQQNINVFGAGFIHEPSESFKFPQGINAYCLRGKKTKEYVSKITGENLDNCLLGDPGLLCSKIFPQNEKKIYDVGIVCHQGDKNSPYLQNINLENKTYTFIDINSPTENVCKRINQCKFILSSALHALIVSDSYGIPNQRIILADNNNPLLTRYDFKFDDYYSIYDRISIPRAIDLKYSTISDHDIDSFGKNYNIPQNTISDFCGKYTKLVTTYFSGLYPIDDGLYSISSKLDNSMVLDITGAGITDGTNLQLYKFNNTDAQKIIVKSVRNGYYSLMAKHSQKMIDVAGCGKTSGTNVWQFSDNGTYAQRWIVKLTEDGYYNIVSKCNKLYLDVSNANASNGTNIQVYTGNSTDGQKFKLNKIS